MEGRDGVSNGRTLLYQCCRACGILHFAAATKSAEHQPDGSFKANQLSVKHHQKVPARVRRRAKLDCLQQQMNDPLTPPRSRLHIPGIRPIALFRLRESTYGLLEIHEWKDGLLPAAAACLFLSLRDSPGPGADDLRRRQLRIPSINLNGFRCTLINFSKSFEDVMTTYPP